MSWQDSFSPFPIRSQMRRTNNRPLQRQLQFEPLEDRQLLALFLVSNTDDAGTGSLRDAIAMANSAAGADEITFDSALSGQTIFLNDELEITEALTIDATVLAENVTLVAGSFLRVIDITPLTGDFTLAGLTITGAGTSESGGGIRSLSRGNFTLERTTVTGNSTINNISDGAGIYAFSDNLTLIDSTISNNSTVKTASRGGGIRLFGDLTLIRSTISGNTTWGAGSYGGGAAVTGDVTMIQSTISGNEIHTNFGGGIWTTGTVTIIQSTVTGNIAGNGGGIFQLNTALNRALSITGSIISGNGIGAGGDLVPDPDSTLTVNHSLIGTGVSPTSGGNNIQTDNPELGPLTENGGPTQTHAPLAGSPAIDAGDPLAVAGTGGVPLFDQRGNNFGRVQNGRIDMGALEVREMLSADFDSDGFINGLDFLLWQIGLGTPAPDAVKTDGDADNDLDADSSDLSVWELQYGTAAPLAAAASALTATEPVSQASLTSSDLADVALAVTLQERADGIPSKREFVAHSPPLEFFSTEPIRLSDSVSGPGISSSATTVTPPDDQWQSPKAPSTQRDALDEVFASVFA